MAKITDNDCGCTVGAIMAGAALLGYLIVCGMLPWLMGTPLRLTWLDGMLTVFGAGVAGKVLGLQWARR